jgi:hypothetical protein
MPLHTRCLAIRGRSLWTDSSATGLGGGKGSEQDVVNVFVNSEDIWHEWAMQLAKENGDEFCSRGGRGDRQASTEAIG